jgi:hypothetical protein
VDEHTSELRRFLLVRNEDVSGVSGTGVIADGTLHASTGQATVVFRIREDAGPGVRSHYSYPEGMDTVEKIHGYDGLTQVVWIDEPNIA